MKHFTLIETVIAIAILAGGVVASSQMIGMATARAAKAKTVWHEQHMLTQAAEYFLLAEPGANLPTRFFPFPGYSAQATCRLLESAPNDNNGEWVLATMTVTLYSIQNKVAELDMNRLMRRRDL